MSGFKASSGHQKPCHQSLLLGVELRLRHADHRVHAQLTSWSHI